MNCICCGNCCRYPNTACELLTSDVAQILDKLTEENVLIDKIYSFMLSNEPLNPLLASFFTKVLGLLLVRKADYVSYLPLLFYSLRYIVHTQPALVGKCCNKWNERCLVSKSNGCLILYDSTAVWISNVEGGLPRSSALSSRHLRYNGPSHEACHLRPYVRNQSQNTQGKLSSLPLHLRPCALPSFLYSIQHRLLY